MMIEKGDWDGTSMTIDPSPRQVVSPAAGGMALLGVASPVAALAMRMLGSSWVIWPPITAN